MEVTYWLLLFCMMVFMFSYNPYSYDYKMNGENVVVLIEDVKNYPSLRKRLTPPISQTITRSTEYTQHRSTFAERVVVPTTSRAVFRNKLDHMRPPLQQYKRDEPVPVSESQKPVESTSSSIVHRSEPVPEVKKPIESTVSEVKKPVESTVPEVKKPVESTSSSAIHHHEIAKPVERTQSSKQPENRVPYEYHVERIPYEPDDTPIGIQYSNRTLPDFGVNATNFYDYPNITYPIPFNQLYNDYTTHYVNFGKPDSRFPSFIHLGDVEDAAFNDADLIVVTGCSQNHLRSNINMMYSVIYTNCNISMVFVDYGLTDEGLQLLISEMSNIHRIHQILHSNAQLYYRKFNFANFPDWWNITEPTTHGGYSWKVVSYFDILNQTKRVVNWSDGGCLWSHSIRRDETRTRIHGIYTPYSGNCLQSWVHPKSRIFLEQHHMVRKILTGRGMCSGGYIFIDYHNATVMNDVIFPLLQCCYTKKCVSPYGTHRKNHRQDQAILSALIHSAKIEQSCHGKYTTMTGFHADCKDDVQKCESRRNRTIRNIAHRYATRLITP